jgi:hypothetical protein
MRFQFNIPKTNLYKDKSEYYSPVFNYLVFTIQLIIKIKGENISFFITVGMPRSWEKIKLSGILGVINKNDNMCLKTDFDCEDYSPNAASWGKAEFTTLSKIIKYDVNGDMIFAIDIKKIEFEDNHYNQINQIYESLCLNNRISIINENLTKQINDFSQENRDLRNKIEVLTTQIDSLNIAPKQEIKPSSPQSQNNNNKKEEDIEKMSCEELQKYQSELTDKLAKISKKIEKLNECSICLTNPFNTVLLQCGHKTACYDCAVKLKQCPICRGEVTRVVKIF